MRDPWRRMRKIKFSDEESLLCNMNISQSSGGAARERNTITITKNLMHASRRRMEKTKFSGGENLFCNKKNGQSSGAAAEKRNSNTNNKRAGPHGRRAKQSFPVKEICSVIQRFPSAAAPPRIKEKTTDARVTTAEAHNKAARCRNFVL